MNDEGPDTPEQESADSLLPARPLEPVAGPSFVGRAWDALPYSLRGWLERSGFEPPLDARSPVVEPTGGGMVIGPPAAGKTTLIAAMWQACSFRAEGEPYELFWRPSTDTERATRLADLLRRAVDDVLRTNDSRKRLEATDVDETYAFGVDGLRPLRGWKTRRVFSLDLSFHDGPGGAMLGLEDTWTQMGPIRERMIRETSAASSLILCFDVNRRHVRLLADRLPQLLPLLIDRQDGRLRARRVLVLLNQVDTLCQRHAAGRDDVTALYLAERLDPVAHALEVMGVGALRAIRGAMRPDAELAVGLCSTWGFTASGRPLFDHHGTPLWGSELDRGSEDDFLQQWRPFGVRDALVYLASGRVGPTLCVLQPSDLVDRAVPALAIPH